MESFLPGKMARPEVLEGIYKDPCMGENLPLYSGEMKSTEHVLLYCYFYQEHHLKKEITKFNGSREAQIYYYHGQIS